MNHCGPFPVMMHGYTHYTVAICHCLDFSVLIQTNSLSAESTCLSLGSLEVFVKRQTSYKLKTVRTDRGPDFTSDDFARLCAGYGIIHQYATPDGHGATGRAERLIRTE